jgi:hypothetical protein
MASSGGGTAAVWLGGADASDLLSLFRYLGFDAGGVDPAQLLAAADWAADARPHRLVRAVRKLLDGAPYPVRAGVAFDDAAFRAEPDILSGQSFPQDLAAPAGLRGHRGATGDDEVRGWSHVWAVHGQLGIASLPWLGWLAGWLCLPLPCSASS